MSGAEETGEVEVEVAGIPAPRQEADVDVDVDVDAPTDGIEAVVETADDADVEIADDADVEIADDADVEFEDKPLDPAEFFALLKASDEPPAAESESAPAADVSPTAAAPVSDADPGANPDANPDANADADPLPDPASPATPAPQTAFGAPPTMDPTAVQQPWGEPWGQWPQPVAPAPQPRRVLKAIVRWTGAVVAMCAVGAATAFVVSIPKRTDVPTLATKNDGRYIFPFYAKPPLPAGALGPGDAANKMESHFGDLRQYLLQPPTGAVVDKAYPGTAAWYPTADFCASFTDSERVCGLIRERGLRHIAARAWTTPDGVQTTIWLLQLPDSDTAYDADSTLLMYPPKAFDNELVPASGPSPEISVFDVRDATTPTKNVRIASYGKVTKPTGSDVDDTLIGRYAHFVLGDTVAVVATRGPKTVPEVPMDQVVTLQAELLR